MIQAGDLQAVVGDDSRDGVGGRQYSGLWSLASKHRVFNCFGNSYAGLIAGELRGTRPHVEVVDDTTVALVRPLADGVTTERRGVYRVSPPHYVDHSLTITDHADRLLRHAGPGKGYREVSWCCYMNSPADPRINFLSNGRWLDYISPKHGYGSNIAPSYIPDDQLEIPPKQDHSRGYPEPFHVDRIGQRFDLPFYFGRLDRMVLILIFDTPRWLRFFLSPSGGGGSLLPGMACPAWDFEWLIPESAYRVGAPYTFRTRLVYKPFVSEDDVLDEYRRAVDELGFEAV
ncbi:MAG: hypothetical protein K8S99_01525 [Planctomycetes bacterium]|nr:hypothetical protein [Planctomycetota bacterium]